MKHLAFIISGTVAEQPSGCRDLPEKHAIASFDPLVTSIFLLKLLVSWVLYFAVFSTTFTPLTLTAGSSGTVFLSAALNADQEGFPANGPANPNSKSNTVTVSGAVGTVQQTTTMTLVISLTNPSFAPTQVNLPIVKIDTSGTPIVDGTTDVPGTITITRPDGTAILPNATNTDNTATFHLHGHSTALMPKKPYKVKFTTSLDLLTVMGLQCPYVTSKGAPACDKSKSFIL